MKKINFGKFIIDKAGEPAYYKEVSFAKAVLWMKKEISIAKKVADQFMKEQIKHVIFEDKGKKAIWVAPTARVVDAWTLKSMFQETQYYIPISVFDKFMGADYLSYKAGIPRTQWDADKYHKKETERANINHDMLGQKGLFV